MGMLARLGVVLGLDSGEFKQGLESADRSLTTFTAKIPTMGTVATAAFAAMTYKALAYSDSISDVAKANEMAVESIMALGEGLAQNGGEAENAGKLISSFTAKIDEAAQGSKDAQTSFNRLGVSLKDLAYKDVTELFDQVINSLAEMDDSVSRAALGMTMFGKAGKGVDFVGLAEGTAHARQEFAEYAKAVELAGDLNDKLHARTEKTIILFTNAFLPTLNAIYDALAKDAKGMEMLQESASTAAKFIAEIFYNAYTVIMAMGAAINLVGALIKDVWNGNDPKKIGEDLKVYTDRLKELWNNAKAFHNEMWQPEKKKEEEKVKKATTGPRRQVTPYKDTEAERLKQMLEMTKLISVEYERHLDYNLANLKTQGEMAFMTESQRKIQEAMNQVADDVDQKLNEIQKKREEAAAHGADPKVLAELDNQRQKVIELGEAYKELTKTEIESQVQAQSTFEYGWNKAMNQYIEDMENSAKQAQAIFESLTSNMESAITNFVKTGKLSFKDLATSIIQDLIAIQLKSSVLAMFKGGADYFGFSLPGKADGGFVQSNQPYMVGERGPELFIPQGSGTIIPSNRMQQGGGSMQTVNNFTINAIDTKSFEDRLYNSSNAVWAANQYATKSLAVGRGRS